MESERLIYKMELLNHSIQKEQKFNIIFLANGSDNRAYEALKILIKKGIEVEYLFFFNFHERETEEDLNNLPSDLENIIKFKKIDIHCSIKDPNSSLNLILGADINISNKLKIGIDISCFTKPYFFYLIKLLYNRFFIQNIEIFYTEPFSYYFPDKIFSSYKSSKGPLSILEIPGFSGQEKRGERRLLILILGFDGDLAKEISEDITPSEIVLINRFHGYIPKYKDMSLIANEKFRGNRDNKLMYTSADHPFEIYNLLTKIAKQYEGYFINIAPLGTKPMALGACLYALSNNNIRVVYPFPENYIKITTEKCWNTWHYNLIFR